MIEIRIINTKEELIEAVPIFEAYRKFYQQAPDYEKSKAFLLNHNANNTHVFIGAYEGGSLIGFTQLYPSFSSVSLQPLYILNDLFVEEKQRSKGVGKRLINHAQQLAVSNNWKGLILETGKDNPAQKLYEKTGWKKDDDYFHYTWTVDQ